jgi:uncharacterized membrane protein HdeD (DUF308 family)
MTTLTRSDFNTAKHELRSARGWLIGLGVVLIGLGAIAFYNLQAATTVSVYVLGVLMLFGAGVQLASAFVVSRWSRFALFLLSALVYGVAGGFTLANPTLAAQALTLGLALALMVSGGMRIWWSIAVRPLPGWGWITASGLVSVLAGIVFLLGWPANSTYLLGIVLAVDLTFQGAMAIAWGVALKEITK